MNGPTSALLAQCHTQLHHVTVVPVRCLSARCPHIVQQTLWDL